MENADESQRNVIDRQGEILLMQMRRSYRGVTPSGRTFQKFDGRILFTLDATSLCAEDSYKHGLEREYLKNEFRHVVELAMKKMIQ